jgi:predicted nucleic acid-binding protein
MIGRSAVVVIDGLVFAVQRTVRLYAGLRAADAFHLAAALVAFEERTSGIEFVTFDARLGEAAAKEGFEILGEAG